jgi:hypothetical protein
MTGVLARTVVSTATFPARTTTTKCRPKACWFGTAPALSKHTPPSLRRRGDPRALRVALRSCAGTVPVTVVSIPCLFHWQTSRLRGVNSLAGAPVMPVLVVRGLSYRQRPCNMEHNTRITTTEVISDEKQTTVSVRKAPPSPDRYGTLSLRRPRATFFHLGPAQRDIARRRRCYSCRPRSTTLASRVFAVVAED